MERREFVKTRWAARSPLDFVVNVNRSQARWFFLRIFDPARPKDPRSKLPFEQDGGAVAYANPWFLDAT